MTMSQRMSKFLLIIHVIVSVGWFGSVACFLALAIVGLNSRDDQLVRSAYLAMDVTAWYVILPFCIATLITGVIQSLGTKWGLIRYYWILIKLLITLISTILLLLHMQPVSYLGNVVIEGSLGNNHLNGIRIQLVFNSGAALVALIVATALSVIKPKGMTQYGWRKQRKQLSESP